MKGGAGGGENFYWDGSLEGHAVPPGRQESLSCKVPGTLTSADDAEIYLY